jgi:hypothetical protein
MSIANVTLAASDPPSGSGRQPLAANTAASPPTGQARALHHPATPRAASHPDIPAAGTTAGRVVVTTARSTASPSQLV